MGKKDRKSDSYSKKKQDSPSETGNRKVMWAIAAVFLLISTIFCVIGYLTPSLPSLDDVEEWDGILPDYEELENELDGEKGTWVKSDFYLNEGKLGAFDCNTPGWSGLFVDEGDYFDFEESSKKSFNISIVWDDPESNGLLAISGFIDKHPDLGIIGATNNFCYSGGGTGTGKKSPHAWAGDGFNVSATDHPIPLRGLFLIIDGGEGEEWYLVSIGHDKNGEFNVEPDVGDSGLSSYLWGLGFAVPGLAILYWSFDPRNK